ncbi:MAG TPA: ParB/RepB/Spo0J family partition protein [Gemmataceae bacterium]|nr:ParB/RepB/Spo0J family partition protein [Gemmataceae bacterium]
MPIRDSRCRHGPRQRTHNHTCPISHYLNAVKGDLMAAMWPNKPVDFFKPDPTQPRKSFDEAELKMLGESLKKKQIVPVLAKPDGLLIDGHRRWMAAKLVGIATLDAIITDEPLSPAKVKEMQLVSALHRSDLKPIEQYEGARSWLLMNPGATVKELAERIDRDPSMLTRILSLSNCIQPVQAAAEEGKLGVSDWYAISKAPEAEQAGLLAAKLGGASRDELERQCRKQSNGALQSVKLDRFKIALAGGATVTLAGQELSLDGAIELLQDVVKAAKKARDESLDVKTFVRVMKDKAKKGGDHVRLV